MPAGGGTNLEAMGTLAFQLVTTWGLRVLGALAVLIIGRMVAGAARSAARRLMERAKADPTLVPFISSLLYYLILAFVVIAVLGLFGIPTASLIAVLGAAGLAVGLALQGTLSNFGAGVMLLVFRPFRVGDFVDVGGTIGTVKEIGIFTTTLSTPDNVQIVVPNASIFGQTMKNYSANETRRVDMVMGISYADDIGKAISTMQGLMDGDARVLKDPAPVIAVDELGDSSVNLVVRPWCKKEDYWALKWDLTRAFKESLEAAGCSIPFPQRDVHVFSEGPASVA
ncbi:MAG TPA: mechanosensitive ion channel domain-containing protein [Candidatus Saccharimonadales bacterium]|nr:mechanosensitive ion channel domain-containing protein [Candidatus Saccharimonadales bacterium]